MYIHVGRYIIFLKPFSKPHRPWLPSRVILEYNLRLSGLPIARCIPITIPTLFSVAFNDLQDKKKKTN